MVRTRFAPSPTGLLHLGGIRTALYAWAFARHHKGKFILRIEDTDTSRSSAEATQVILNSLEWLEIDYDEGPYYQMKRLDRYKDVVATLLENGQAYHCYMTTEELDSLRDQQRQNNQKPRYDGRWRPENRAKLGLTVPTGYQPVIRFRNPDTSSVQWNDIIKGSISISNEELDDFVIVRQDGTPTYNFCVVVDDYDMEITHVIRGDDHINNTPKQINLLCALGAPIPQYAHLSTIRTKTGQKLSKRFGATSVLQYRDDGYLPAAIINYLSRLGWSHGDDEIFSREQFIEWFDLSHVSGVPAQFDPEKLMWLNKHYLHHTETPKLVDTIGMFLSRFNINTNDSININTLVEINKSRSQTIVDLAEQIACYYSPRPLEEDNLSIIHSKKTQDILLTLDKQLDSIPWQREELKELIKRIAQDSQLKLSDVAIPLRLCLLGTTQSASFEQVLNVLGRNISQQRIRKHLL
ncbi:MULTISPECIES: glutamate--tRNA ligase [Candidatus Ichthyocystis]|uniref:Glutamate--tRNA ligase n=1 Tax=Candidatus Ichthyocystis hellenicum TaxID=1561003 RepID=A0A0S4LZW8_9BURK|nr:MULTISPECIES: glutamate--tRNA ligase [Ichthyocystis]CUT17038.1 glutamyl-tRNA synthetase [Candidatus Ichthyocystis hellenicum]